MSDVIVTFKAGRLLLDGKVLRPDPRRGRLAVIQSEDGLVHVEWRERNGDDSITSTSSSPEIDTVVFPEEAHLEQVCVKALDLDIGSFQHESRGKSTM